MAFRDCNVHDDPVAARLWDDLGRPVIPSLVVDGVAVPILHRSQLARLLGLPLADEAAPSALAWDCADVLDAWIEGIRGLTLTELLEPTRSRERTLRNLTVNVFHPFELLPGALEDGEFPWDPDLDPEREAALTSVTAIDEYASERATGWRWFLAGVADRLDAEELPVVRTPRGEIGFADLLAQQRWHAAFHYRQLVAHRARTVLPVARPFDLGRLAGLDLPDEVF